MQQRFKWEGSSHSDVHLQHSDHYVDIGKQISGMTHMYIHVHIQYVVAL